MKQKKSKVVLWLMSVMMLLNVCTGSMPWVIYAAGGTVDVTIHYYRMDQNYEAWNVWTWIGNTAGKSEKFETEDSYGKIAKYTMPYLQGEKEIGFIVRKGEWQAKDGDTDRFAPIKDGRAEVWVLQGEAQVFLSEDEAKQALIPKIKGASLVALNKVQLRTNLPMLLNGNGSEGIEIKSEGQTIEITEVKNIGLNAAKEPLTTNIVEITVKQNLAINQTYTITKENFKGENVITLGDKLLTSQAFDAEYAYHGNDLGAVYSKEQTKFRVWAPFAEEVELMTYKSGDIASKEKGKAHPMKKDVKGTWITTLKGNQKGIFYTYKVTNRGVTTEAGDPYAKAVGINGDRSAVVDLSVTNPSGWNKDKRPTLKNPEDAVIYELHVRDLSTHKDSGIKNKGKFIAFKEAGTTGPMGVTTGLDHLKELGITHVQIQPVYDFATIDEKSLDKNEFNWGYDPKNYNVPEGSYATDPYKPEVRIHEYKQLVQTLHQNGIGIIMDVVYNHTNDNTTSKFHQIVPGYYYRMNEDGTFKNGSGCGSETASERAMMRKYIIDSVKYWVNEYHVDGFRFDLMGLHDVETMRAVRAELNKINPSIIIYGEGWDMGNLPRNERAIQPHAKEMLGIGYFNDNIRDNLKGPFNNEKEHGFVDGKPNYELEIMQAAAGSITYNDVVRDYNYMPAQSINYAEAHDNHTLWDKLKCANPDASEEDLIKMHKLANAVVLTAQGVPFLQAGEDFLRTKYDPKTGRYDENSYKSPDSINQLDWRRKAEYLEVFNYFKGLIELRKSHPAFRMTSAEAIQNHLAFVESPNNTVAYVLKDGANKDKWENIFVAYNANKEPVKITMPKAEWKVVVKDGKAGVKTLATIKDDQVTIAPLSALVMHTNDLIEIKDLFKANKTVKIEGIQHKDILYLPVDDLARAAGAGVETRDDGKTVTITKGTETISIQAGTQKITVNGSPAATKESVTVSAEGKIMVSASFAEGVLKVRVFADYKRFHADTQRADETKPDVYIMYP